jgi:hypothetical protein
MSKESFLLIRVFVLTIALMGVLFGMFYIKKHGVSPNIQSILGVRPVQNQEFRAKVIGLDLTKSESALSQTQNTEPKK